ncbi:MAG: hypothetical protein MI784_10450 [Cytophagales bacterium]|nr:hypothetical protein [Cytophagales bacterium]
MELEINFSFLENYASTFSRAVLSDFFLSREKATGNDLLKLTPSEQVNLFILKQLFEKWQKEMSKLESPYFDFQISEVRQALHRFMNVLSKNISVGQEHLPPLVEQAAADALLLAFSPLDYFEKSLLEGAGESISYESICQEHKYNRLHREEIEAVKTHMEKHILRSISVEKFITILSEQLVAENDSNHTEFIQQLASIAPVKASDFLHETKPPEPAPAAESFLFDSLAKDFQAEIGEPEQQTDKQEEPPVTKEWSFGKSENSSERVFTLNDRLASQRKTSLAESHQHKSHDSLLDSLSINQKFRFMNELFNGQREQLNASLSKLDHCSNAREALQVIEKELIPYHSWDSKSAIVKDFISVIKRHK